MKIKKLMLLCDYGLDDAVATAYILENADEFELIDILPISGNFSFKTSFNNAKRILANYGNVKNARLIDTSSVKQPFENLYDIHGNDGIGDILPLEDIADIKALDYNDWLKTVDSDYTILSLGPCTVTLDILKNAGELPLILMGGNINEPPNYNGYEFNHGLDTEAFSECIKYPHMVATLDTCHNPLLDFYKIQLNDNSLFARFAKRSAELSKERNEKIACIYDLVAAYYLLNQTKFDVVEKIDKDGNRVSVLNYTDSKTMF